MNAKKILVLIAITISVFLYLENKKTVIRVSYINQPRKFSLSELPMIEELLKERFDKITIDHENYDLIIDGHWRDEAITNRKSIKLYFTQEAHKPDLKKYDLSIGFDRIDDEKYIRIPLYYMWYKQKISTSLRRDKRCNPKEKPYFACFLVSRPSSENPKLYDGCVARESLFYKLSNYKKVMSGGKFLNNIGKRVSKNSKAQRDKWLSNCKFMISYENQKYPGYITEKPFQSYLTGSIPIYYATEDYKKDINPEAVIFAENFKNEDELVDYIIKVDNDDNMYCDIYNQPLVVDEKNNYENVKNKLREKLFKLLDEKLGSVKVNS